MKTKSIKNAATKITVIIILALILITSFSSGFFSFNKDAVIAEVGKKKVLLSTYQRAFENEKSNLQKVLQRNITPEQAKELHRIVLDDLITVQLLNNLTDSLDLYISDGAVIKNIVNNKHFYNKGKFSKQKLQDILRNNNISEEEYVKSLREHITSSLLLQSILYDNMDYTALSQKLYEKQFEKRIANIYTITSSNTFDKNTADIPLPTNKELQRLYQENKKHLKTIEYRSAYYVFLNKDDIKTNVPEQEVNNAVERFKQHRDISYMIFHKHEDAQSALDKIHHMKSFAKGSEELKQSKKINEVFQLNDITQSSLPRPLQQKVWAMQAGEISDILETPWAWYIVTVRKIREVTGDELVKLKASLKQDLLIKHVESELEKRITQMQKDLATKLTLSDVAAKYNLKLYKISETNVRGFDKQGHTVDTHNISNLLATIFTRSLEEKGKFIQYDKGYFNVYVDRIIPTHLQSFTEARDTLVKIWKEQVMQHKLEQVVQAIQKHKDYNALTYAKVVLEKNKAVFNTQTTTIADPTQQYPEHFIRDLFTLSKGGFTQAFKYKNALIVAQLYDIVPAKSDKDNLIIKELNDRIQGAISSSMYIQLKQYMTKKFSVKVNKALL